MSISRRGFVSRLATVAGSIALAPIAIASADGCYEDMTPTAYGTKPNIVQTAMQAGSFNTLLAAVKEAGLVEALSGEGALTVFAPTDEAFAKLGEETIRNARAFDRALRRDGRGKGSRGLRR